MHRLYKTTSDPLMHRLTLHGTSYPPTSRLQHISFIHMHCFRSINHHRIERSFAFSFSPGFEPVQNFYSSHTQFWYTFFCHMFYVYTVRSHFGPQLDSKNHADVTPELKFHILGCQIILDLSEQEIIFGLFTFHSFS
jgi:hypothetical protein